MTNSKSEQVMVTVDNFQIQQWFTVGGFKLCSGYNKDYIYALTRSGSIKSSKFGRRLLLDMVDAIRHLSQTKRNFKTGGHLG